MSRNLYCIANFKMNKNRSETVFFLDQLNSLIDIKPKTRLVVCPPFTSLTKSRDKILIGSQNINSNESGAYTGEISSEMIKNIGAEYVILGHSERREYFKETNQEINKKVAIALKYKLKPILCIGETLVQRKNNEVEKTLKNQLSKSLENVKSDIIVAYEPVWAIGTGETATAEIIIEAHQIIRKILNDIGFDGQKISILYGGSVNRNNARELIALNGVDGFLIGGASLDVDHLYDIYKFIEESF
ncbi:MAG: triose-phosphate isomerase [Candidatus Marinimicrobia bacterium]|nr:triose-phosphate isomerase [Candidatus Neomarinimicrobiota bacterium]